MSAVSDPEDVDDVPPDFEQNPVGVPALAVEQLAQALPVSLGFGCLGATLGVLVE